MKEIDFILKKIALENRNCYKHYRIEENVLILELTRHHESSIYRIRELVQIDAIVKEYLYSCKLLFDGSIEIKKEE